MEQIFNAIHIKRQRKAQRLIKRIALGGSYDITSIERKHTHSETGTKRKILAVSFVSLS